MNLLELIRHVEKSIILASLGISKLNIDIYYIEGMSSPKNRRLLNLLCERPNTNYLEIGMWRGSTLISALYNNEKTVNKAVAIDNFSEFDQPLFTNSINFEESVTHNPKIPLSMEPVKNHLQENIGKYLSSIWEVDNKLTIIDHDCFDEKLINAFKLENYTNKFNLYFYDGNHEEESQYQALVKYYDFLDNKFVLVVDDWTNQNAEKGTRRAIKDLNLNVKYENILPARYNGDIWQWWAGLGVFVLEK